MQFFIVLSFIFLGIYGPCYGLNIVTSIPPLTEAVQALSPAGTYVYSLARPSDDPDQMALTTKQIRQLSEADLIVCLGTMPFEHQLQKRIQSDTKLLSKLLILFPSQNKTIKLNSYHDDQFHSGNDPHIWMSVGAMRDMLPRLSQKLVYLAPENRSQILVQEKDYDQKLKLLQETIKQDLDSKSGRTLMIFHPSLGYLCQDYNLRQLSIETHGQLPSGKHLLKQVSQAKAMQVNAIFVESGVEKNQATALAKELNIPIITLHLLTPHYIAMMRNLSKTLSQYL